MSKQAIVNLAAAARIGASANSTGVDISDLTGNATLVLNSSATEGAGMTLDVKIQHSDTLGGTYTDTGVSFTQVTNAAASFQTQLVSVDQFKKFIRVVSTLAGSTPFATRSVTLVGNSAY